MKKILIISLMVFLVYIIIRLFFSYTIVDIPYVFGTETHVSRSKYDFPICIINPIKINSIKKKIIAYHENIKKEKDAINEEYRCWFFGELEKASDFEIISVNTCFADENSFLLQSKKEDTKRCVVFFDKESDKILRLEF